MKHLTIPAGLVLLFTGWPAAAADAMAPFEATPVVSAADLLPRPLLNSPYHRVRSEVELAGGLAHFQVDSDFGTDRVTSVALLLGRIHEINTLAQTVGRLREANAPVFDALPQQLQVRGDSVKGILGRPMQTTSRLASQFTDKMGRTLQGEVLSPGQAADPADGVSELQRRAVAGQLNLDVYSSNERVQAFIDTLARTRTAGRIGVLPAVTSTSQIDPGGIKAAEVKSRIKNLSREELAYDNRLRLTAMGVSPLLGDRFLRHPHLSPTHQTAIVAYLEIMSGVSDRATLINATLAADSEAAAAGFVVLARLLARYHLREGRLQGILSSGGQVFAVTLDNRILLPLATDLSHWQAGLAEPLRRLRSFAERGPSVLVTSGRLTPLARAAAGALGFEVREAFLGS